MHVINDFSWSALISNSHGWISLALLKWRFKWQFIQFLSTLDMSEMCNKFRARYVFDCLKVHSANSLKVQIRKVYGFEGDCWCCVIVIWAISMLPSIVTHPANAPALQTCKFHSPIIVCLGLVICTLKFQSSWDSAAAIITSRSERWLEGVRATPDSKLLPN